MRDLRPLACVKSHVGLLCTGLLGLALAPTTSAQVELPQKPRSKVVNEEQSAPAGKPATDSQGNPAPGPARGDESTFRSVTPIVDPRTLKPVGTLTNEVINGGTPDVLGFDPVTKRTPARAQEGGVDLPSGPRRPVRRDQPATSPAPVPATTTGPEPTSDAVTGDGAVPEVADDARGRRTPGFGSASLEGLRPAVRLVYETVASATKPEERVVKEGARTLASYGADGLVAARVALDQDHAPLFVLGVRALLEAGSAEDHDEVLAAIRRKMPAKAAANAVQALVELDPVRASPEVLVDLLRHPQSAARSAAQSALEARSSVALVPLLAPILGDQSADTRDRPLHCTIGVQVQVQSPSAAFECW